MVQSNKNLRELCASDGAVHHPKPEQDWKDIAEEASKEQDGAKLLELTNRLLAALDNRQGAEWLLRNRR